MLLWTLRFIVPPLSTLVKPRICIPSVNVTVNLLVLRKKSPEMYILIKTSEQDLKSHPIL